jgi:chorismate-pyruvate lyase
MAGLLDVDVGEEVNHRTVRLVVDGVPYVHAVSLSPIGRMPDEVRRDMMRADIPIGKILRNYGIETRRDFDTIQMEVDGPLFGSHEYLSRTYRIVHHNDTLMWIKERFPADDRWLL